MDADQHDGTELTGPAEAAMCGYLAEHPRGEHGSHRYAAADLGLDTAALQDRFATYRSRFAT